MSDLSPLFDAVLRMSITASFAIVIVLAARLLLRGAPKGFTCAMWAVVLFRLVCPVSVQSPASLMPQPGNIAGITQDIMAGTAPAALPPAAIPLPIPPAAAVPPDSAALFLSALSRLWAPVIALLLLYSAVSYLLLRRKVAGATPAEAGVYETDAIRGPFVMGFIHPKIYLPTGIAGEEREYILLHERIHIRRLHYLIKPAAFLVLCVHWFNPLCWLAFALFGRDLEMSCDEGVIRELGGEIKRSYSGSLLTMATKGHLLGGSPLAFGESGVKQRIKNVLHYHPIGMGIALFVFFGVALVVGGMAFNPVEKYKADFIYPQPDFTPQQHLNLMVTAGMIYEPWDTASRDPDDLVEFYAALHGMDARVPWGLTADHIDSEAGEPLTPREYVEAVAEAYFTVDKTAIRGSSYYRPRERAYEQTGLGGATDATVLSVAEDAVGNATVISFEATQDGVPFGRGELTIQHDAQGGYRYRSLTLVTSQPQEASALALNPQGLTPEEAAELQAQSQSYAEMTPEEQALAREGGTIGCVYFRHLWWEESIDMNLIRYVGVDAFDGWARAPREAEQCASIYDFAKQFGLDYEVFAGLVTQYGLQELYPLERVKPRFVFFGLPMGGGETPTLSAADLNIYSKFGKDFLELAQAGEGPHYHWQTNQLVGAEKLDSFITAVKNKQAAQLTYFVDSTSVPYIYVFTAKAGEDFYTIDQYQEEGPKESFRSSDAYKGETYYRFGYNLAGDRFPLYVPFGVDDPARAAELNKLYDDYLVTLTGAGIAFDYWSDPGTIGPESFMAYYVLSSQWWQAQSFDSTEKEVPGAEVESFILAHFDVPIRRLRAAVNYDETKQTYTFPIENYGYGPGDVRVTNYKREGDMLTLYYEAYSPADGTTVSRQGELTIQVNGDGYKYRSCESWMLE